MESTVLSILLLIVIYLLFSLNKLEGQVKRLNYTINQIAAKLEIHEPPVNEEIHHLLKEGNETEAIKRVREEMGLSLIEAKKYVDNIKK